MLARNNACFRIVDRAGLQCEILGRSRIRGSSEGSLPRTSMVSEVGTIVQRANVYAVVFDIDSHRCTRRVRWTIEVDRRQARAGVRNSRGGLLASLNGAASSYEDQQA